jgi:hypothetical protein
MFIENLDRLHQHINLIGINHIKYTELGCLAPDEFFLVLNFSHSVMLSLIEYGFSFEKTDDDMIKCTLDDYTFLIDCPD